MTNIATSAYPTWARAIFLAFFLSLGGCTLLRPTATPLVYDFGPGVLDMLPTGPVAKLPLLELATPQSSAALNSPAVLYRLGYADAQQLRPYTLARWSMPPAQLVGQRLREHLGLRRAIVSPGEIVVASPARPAASTVANAAPPVASAVSSPARPVAPTAVTPAPPVARPEPLLNLRLDLEEFSQWFESPDKSSGLLRLRATVTQRSSIGETLLAQRSFVARQVATTPDAAGGVRALAAATDQVIGEIEVWLGQVAPAGKAP